MAEGKNESKETMKAKEMLSEAGKSNLKIKYNDRTDIEIIKDTKHYKKGEKYSPATVMAKQLIKQKIAKEI